MGNEHGRAHLQRFSASEHAYSEDADQTFYWNILLQHVSKMRSPFVLAGPEFLKQAGPIVSDYAPRVISNERNTHNFARLVLKLHNSLNRYISSLPRLPEAEVDLEEVYNDEEDLLSLLLMFRLLCGYFVERLPLHLLYLMLSAAVPESKPSVAIPKSPSAQMNTKQPVTSAIPSSLPVSSATPTSTSVASLDVGTSKLPLVAPPAPSDANSGVESMPLASAGTLVLKQLGEILVATRIRAKVWREAARTFLVLLSVQRLLSPTALIRDPVLLTLHTHPTLLRPRDLIRTLLVMVASGMPLPSAASTLASLPIVGKWMAPADPPQRSPYDSPVVVAEQLLLALTLRPHAQFPANPFREALGQLVNIDDSAKDSPVAVSFKVLFDSLRFRVTRASDLCLEIQHNGPNADLSTSYLIDPEVSQIRREHAGAVMVLYLLLTAAPSFAAYARARTDLDELVIPLLHYVHVAHHHLQLAQDSPEHLDLILVVLLILSRDSTVCESWRAEVLATVPWYREQLLVNVSVADLAIVVLTRVAGSCIRNNKDSYRLTNALAILGNLSSTAVQLHPHAARLVVDTLRTSLTKLQKLMKAEHDQSQIKSHERSVCEDAAVLLLEILNVMLEKDGPSRNVNLLYELVHQSAQLIMPAHLAAQPAAETLSSVLLYLQTGLEKSSTELLSSAQALEILRQQANGFPPELIKKIPPLHFNYAENDASREFFVPYIWKLVSEASGVFFPRASP